MEDNNSINSDIDSHNRHIIGQERSDIDAEERLPPVM